MAKEQIRVKINGKSIVYDGHPENKPKDLIDILVKLGVSNETAVTAFRENIEDNAQYTDADITDMFQKSKKAREERKKNKESSTTPAKVEKKEKAEEKEVPQKITLVYRGRQFSFEGLPSSKKHAVVQLLCKQNDVTPEIAVETFRENLPDEKATDEEIWAMVEEAKAARASRKAGGAAAAKKKEEKTTTTTAAAAPAAAEATGEDETGEDMVAMYTGVSAEERESIDKFIEQVLNAPPVKIDERLRENPTLDRQDDTELLLTQRNQGKIPVYCQEDNQSGTKLVHATPTMTFEEFSSMVEKKYGRKMALSFYEDNDIIEMDDDDVFAMFLEMCQGPGGKKHKLICRDPSTIQRVAEDNITEEKGDKTKTAVQEVRNFSNGELTVTEEKVYLGHALAVYCCAFSPDGYSFVTASRDKTVRVWDTQKGTCSVMKGGHNDFVLSCDFSPKGNRCCSSSVDRTIKVWNVTTSTKVATLKAHDDKVYCVQYNPTGEYIVSASCDHTLRVWNADSCSKIVTLRGHTLAVFSCGFSKTSGSKYVVSGSDDRLVKIWDWKAGKEVNTLVGHVGTVWSVCFSHRDDYIVSASMDHELKLWDAKTGVCIRTLAGHKVPTHHAIFSPNDKYILSCARDCAVKVWRTEDGELVETILGHKETVYHIEMMNNKLLTSSLDRTLKLWDIKPNGGEKEI